MSRPAVESHLWKPLNHLIHSFEPDIVIMDYRVRGFTRDLNGSKH